MKTKKIQASLDDHLHYVGIRMPVPIIDYVDRIAARQLRTRSDILRSLVVQSLRASGVMSDGAENEAEVA